MEVVSLKKVFAVLLVMAFGLTACSSSSASVESFVPRTDSDMQVIQSAYNKLKDYPNYIVDYELERGDSFLYSLAIRNNDAIYTEYPINDEGVLGTEKFGNGSKYILAEYRFPSGDWYSFFNTGTCKYPKAYKEYRDGVADVYIDVVLDNTKSIIKSDELASFDTVYGHEDMSYYILDLNPECFKYILGSNSYGEYASVRDESISENMTRYCEWMQLETSNQFACGALRAYVYLDNKDRYRGITFEASGTGDVVYYTGLIVDLDNQTIREAPDVSNYETFVESITAVSEVIGTAQDYNDAREMMRGFYESFQGGDSVDED